MTAAILTLRPAVRPDAVPPRDRAADFVLPRDRAAGLVRLFALDRLPAGRRLACHWHRDGDGRLAAVWEPDIGRFREI